MADQSKKYKFDISNLNLHYGGFHALKDYCFYRAVRMWKVYIFKDFEPHE